MRLLNVSSFQFQKFFNDEERPPYVIASHRWRNDEITYQQMLGHRQNLSTCNTQGFQKVRAFCNFVKSWATGLEWIRIDTCCINKDSDAEASEAINSMFRWDQEAYVCIAYLHDVPDLTYNPENITESFKHSTWFKRGWTLQELLAPKLVVFLDSQWEVLGHKAPLSSAHQSSAAATMDSFSAWQIRSSLNELISQATGISQEILANYSTAQSLSLDEKLSWMAGRATTRIEDRAYCMLGICGVTMPLIYGERDKAHVRLMEEVERDIARKSSTRILMQTNSSPEVSGSSPSTSQAFYGTLDHEARKAMSTTMTETAYRCLRVIAEAHENYPHTPIEKDFILFQDIDETCCDAGRARHRGSMIWLQNLASDEVSDARFLVLTYSSKVLKNAFSRLRKQGLRLLIELKKNRQMTGTMDRPIVFWARGIAGFVLISMFLAASCNAEYSSIIKATNLIGFSAGGRLLHSSDFSGLGPVQSNIFETIMQVRKDDFSRSLRRNLMYNESLIAMAETRRSVLYLLAIRREYYRCQSGTVTSAELCEDDESHDYA